MSHSENNSGDAAIGNPASEGLTSRWRDAWSLPPGVTFLNHGSFGLMPQCVRDALHIWQNRLEEEPIDFFVRVQEGALADATATLARFVGAHESNVAMVDNATVAMNAVAQSFPLTAGDEVVLTNYEYGAVRRIWERACQRACAKLVTADIPFPPGNTTGSGDPRVPGVELIGEPPGSLAGGFASLRLQAPDAAAAKKDSRPLAAAITPRTKLVVVSHILSEPAHIMPIEPLISALRERGVAVCVDGPHAVAQLPLALDGLGCDFYTASCHKWLCGPLGSGFLYVAPKWHDRIEPPILSWGRLEPARPHSWREEFWWNGTRSLATYLAVPAAIEFLNCVGPENFRRHGHALSKLGAELVDEVTGLAPPADRDPWYVAMTLAELPPGETHALRAALWEQYRIEIPVLNIAGRRFLRISAHLYNTPGDMHRLAAAIGELLDEEKRGG